MVHQAALAAEQAASGEQALGIVFLVGLAVVAILCVVLFVTALVSVLSSELLTGGGKALWVLLVLMFPLLGSLCWFIWGRKRSAYRSDRVTVAPAVR